MPDYYSTLRTEIEPLLPAHFGVIMDVGCGSGTTLKWIKDNFPTSRVIGVEIDPSALESARKLIKEVRALDIEEDGAELVNFHGQIDVLLLLDVLEHLRDPWACLERLRKLLSPAGVVIASIPNVRNVKVTLPLLFMGQWKYEEAGILDRTHLRFFTRTSIEELFKDAGYTIQSMERTGPLTARRVRSRSGLIAYILNLFTMGLIKDFLTHQFLVSARPNR